MDHPIERGAVLREVPLMRPDKNHRSFSIGEQWQRIV